jgi:hypothetical protein
MKLFVECYLLLIRMSVLLRRGDMEALHASVRSQRVLKSTIDREDAVELCRAMDVASVFFPTTVRCLQRSAATAILLRRHGIQSEMVIGIQLMPLKSHAWVEVGGRVVNDKPHIQELYQQLDRC